MTINRPEKYNAMTVEMLDETLPDICRRVEEDDAIRVLVITGSGKAFCTGADVGSRLAELSDEVLLRPLGGYAIPFARIRKPVVAAINGVTAGGGLGLALLADLRIASDAARFTTAFVRRGLTADTGVSVTLPRLVGVEKALHLLMTAEMIDATEALRIGMVGRVVPHDRLMDEVLEYARLIAAGPPIAQAFAKEAVYAGLHRSFEEQLPFESWQQSICLKTQDFAEGRAAFLEKRAPTFRGR